jgi:hypothetical protein
VKNKWGGVVSGSIMVGTNYVDASYIPSNMYVIAAKPITTVSAEESFTLTVSKGILIDRCAEFGFIWMYFASLVAAFLAAIRFRVERIDAYLLSRVRIGAEKNLLASIFLCEHQTANNAQFRSHLFHAVNCVRLCLCIPVCIVLAWGLSTVYTVQPAAFGYGIFFLGTAYLLLWYGFSVWREHRWRMTSVSFVCLGLAVVLSLCFVIAVIFADPYASYVGTRELNFTALSLVFGTLNSLPLLIVVYRQDKAYRFNLKKLMRAVTSAVYDAKNSDNKARSLARASHAYSLYA